MMPVPSNPDWNNKTITPYKFNEELQMRYLQLRYLGQGHITAARRVGVHPKTVQRFMAGHPDFRDEVNNARKQLVEVAELGLFEALENREPWAITFALNKFKEARPDWGDHKSIDVTVEGSIEHVAALPAAEQVAELTRRMAERKSLERGEPEIIEGEVIEDEDE
jgi:hypothetical protein